MCLSGNLVTLYLFYEMMTLLSVPLVLHIGTRKAFDAAYRYLGFSVAGAGLGLLGLFLLQGFCTTDLFTPGVCWIRRGRRRTGGCCWRCFL